jgi:hypothetical protein
VYSAVYLFPEESSPPANNLDYCSATRQSRNQRQQEGLSAEYAKYAENRLPPGSPSVYSVYSAVYLFPEESSPPANNLDYCSAEVQRRYPEELAQARGERGGSPTR